MMTLTLGISDSDFASFACLLGQLIPVYLLVARSGPQPCLTLRWLLLASEGARLEACTFPNGLTLLILLESPIVYK
jgi:hypothetical protein